MYPMMAVSQRGFVSFVLPATYDPLGPVACASRKYLAPIKSSCYFCPFGSVDRWRWLYEHHPELYAKAMALEEHSKHFPAQRLTDQAFRERTDLSLRALGEVFRSGGKLPAPPAVEQQPCGAECMT
ncbi:MAG: hypothetical protein HY690_12670 [Chloroflexi bacterium]|nr:hypothetical protein [Chloroflexota bacterium]